MRRFGFGFAVAGAALWGTIARAQLPAAIQPDLFPFPGSHVGPGSAASAGVALADRWLGNEPFANPAFSRPWTLAVSPALLHVSRQDLRADHRGYEETAAYFDAAGAYLGFEGGPLGVSFYGYQPVVRFEDNLFQTGPVVAPTGTLTSGSSARELRGGLAVSLGRERWRFGIAGEWTHRVDHYEVITQAGAPIPTTTIADFSGGGLGGQAGLTWNFGEGPGGAVVGGAVRFVPELELTGDESLSDASGTTTNPLSTRREAGWEGGLSLRYVVTDAFRALAAVGGRTGHSYAGWGVQSGPGGEWKVGGEYHDMRDPWTVRFGFGQEQQSDVPEPRAGVVGLGFGIQFESTQLDFGILHRSFKHGEHPASAEDRLVLTLVQGF